VLALAGNGTQLFVAPQHEALEPIALR